MGGTSALAPAPRTQSKMSNRSVSRAQSKLGPQQSTVRARSKQGFAGRISEIEEEDDAEVELLWISLRAWFCCDYWIIVHPENRYFYSHRLGNPTIHSPR